MMAEHEVTVNEHLLQLLENLGPLWQTMTNGVLQRHVKQLLEQLTPKQREEYFCKRARGLILLCEICSEGNLEELRYAIEILCLHKMEPSCHEDADCLHPLLSALSSSEPSVEVVHYLLQQGYSVTPEAYCLWASCQWTSRNHLSALLDLLLQYGSHAVPPIWAFLPAIVCMNMVGGRSFRDRKSIHVGLLRDRVSFTVREIRQVAHCGLGRILEQMTDNDDFFDEDLLADLFEICEFTRYCTDPGFPRKLRYFRKSLQLRQQPGRKQVIQCGKRRSFRTVEEIKRIEKQIVREEYYELTWQMMFAAARAEASKSDITPEFLKGILNLDQALEVKSFIMSSGHFLGGKCSFLENLRRHCEFVICGMKQPKLSMLKKLYDCLEEIFVDGDEPLRSSLALAISSFILRASTHSNPVEQLKQIHQNNELLYTIAYGLHTRDIRQDIIDLSMSLILRLLKMGASLGTLPGHKRSTLRLIISSRIDLDSSLCEVLRLHAGCSLDLSSEERKKIGFPEKIKTPFPLKCIAAAACRTLPRQILEKNLPQQLVNVAQCHPRIHYRTDASEELPSDDQ